MTIVIVVPVVAIVLAWVLHRTALGRAVEAAADNATLARLSSVDPKIVSTVRLDDRRLPVDGVHDHAVGPGRQRRAASTSSAR